MNVGGPLPPADTFTSPLAVDRHGGGGADVGSPAGRPVDGAGGGLARRGRWSRASEPPRPRRWRRSSATVRVTMAAVAPSGTASCGAPARPRRQVDGAGGVDRPGGHSVVVRESYDPHGLGQQSTGRRRSRPPASADPGWRRRGTSQRCAALHVEPAGLAAMPAQRPVPGWPAERVLGSSASPGVTAKSMSTGPAVHPGSAGVDVGQRERLDVLGLDGTTHTWPVTPFSGEGRRLAGRRRGPPGTGTSLGTRHEHSLQRAPPGCSAAADTSLPSLSEPAPGTTSRPPHASADHRDG